MLLLEGIHQISMEDYHADPCPEPSLSAHVAHALLSRSPAHARHIHPRLNQKYEPEESSRLDFGSCAHEVLLLPPNARRKIVEFDPSQYPNAKGGGVATGWTNKAIRTARDACRANGDIPVLSSTWATVKHMVDEAKNFIEHTSLRGCFEKGEAEQTIIWREEANWCRARPDLIAPGIMLDYKSTTNARPEYVIRQVIGQMGYDVQQGFYRRGAETHGCAPFDFVFLFQEIESPFCCSLVGLEPTFLHASSIKVEAAIGIWSECLRLNRWPAYAHDIHYAEAPAWMMAEAERFV